MSVTITVNELVDNYVPGSVAKHSHRSKLEESVFKATQSKPQAAKQKHVRAIIIDTWNAVSGAMVLQELFKRPIGGKDIVLFKTLVVIHRVLRDGHPNCLEDAWNRKDFLESLQAQFQSALTPLGAMDGAYLDFIVEKVKFHKKHPDVGGEILLQKFKEKHKKFNAKNVLVMVKDLLNLQKSLINFTSKVFQSQGLQPYRLAGIVPAVVESYAIYTMTEYFLRKLSEIDIEQDEINDMIDLFLQFYPIIRQFYFHASTIPFVTSEMSVPSLDVNPPKFEKKRKRSHTTSGKDKKPPVLLSPADLLSSGSDILNSSYGTSQPQPASAFNPFALVPSQQIQQQQQQFHQQQAAAQYAAQQAAAAQLAAQQQAAAQYAAQQAAAQAAAEQAALQARLAEQQQRESVAVLKEHIRQLEARLEQLKQQLRELEAENARLTQELNTRDSGLANTRTQLEQQLSKEHGHFLAESQKMKTKLQEQEKQFEKEKSNLVAQQIGFSKGSVDKALSQFDDPSHAGNRNATGEDILRNVIELKEKYESLYSAISNESDIVGASRALAAQVGNTLNDVKGTLTKIEDPALRLQLSEYGRDIGRECGKMIGYAKEIGKRKANDNEAKFLADERNKFGGLVQSVHQTIEESQRRTDSGDLEDLASRELSAAARVIEEAAAALLRQSQTRKLQPTFDGEDIEGSIMEAAMQVTKMTQTLVKSAVLAQQERVKEGLAARATGDKYFANPTWTEGLITAGKGVAEATRQLVIFANKAAQGQVDDAALIAAARAVNKPTAQLVSATHSTRLTSQSALAIQAELDTAAASVTKAAGGLVDAAKLHTKKVEQTSLRDAIGAAALKIGAEIIQATKVQQLEKDLENARKVLFDERKKEYAAVRAPRGNSGSGANLPAFNQQPSNAPVATPFTAASSNSSVDTSSILGSFGQSVQDESQLKVPSYMQKLTSVDRTHVPTAGTSFSPFDQLSNPSNTNVSVNPFGVSSNTNTTGSQQLHDIWGNPIPQVQPQAHNPFQ